MCRWRYRNSNSRVGRWHRRCWQHRPNFCGCNFNGHRRNRADRDGLVEQPSSANQRGHTHLYIDLQRGSLRPNRHRLRKNWMLVDASDRHIEQHHLHNHAFGLHERQHCFAEAFELGRHLCRPGRQPRFGRHGHHCHFTHSRLCSAGCFMGVKPA